MLTARRYVNEKWCKCLTSQWKPNAKNDYLETTINWGNNTDVTYGGKFAADTRFFKTEGPHPILQADINIQPTKVVLNDNGMEHSSFAYRHRFGTRIH